MTRTGLLTLGGGLLAMVWLAVPGAARGEVEAPFLRPGQEATLLTLLRPGESEAGCTLAGVSVEKSIVSGRYEGDGGAGQLVLGHPNHPEAGAQRTPSLAVLSADPGCATTMATVALARSSDGALVWSVASAPSSGEALPEESSLLHLPENLVALARVREGLATALGTENPESPAAAAALGVMMTRLGETGAAAPLLARARGAMGRGPGALGPDPAEGLAREVAVLAALGEYDEAATRLDRVLTPELGARRCALVGVVEAALSRDGPARTRARLDALTAAGCRPEPRGNPWLVGGVVAVGLFALLGVWGPRRGLALDLGLASAVGAGAGLWCHLDNPLLLRGLLDLHRFGLLPLTVVAVQVLRQTPRRDRFILLGLVAIGVLLRLTLAPETLMGVAQYQRVPVIVTALARSALPFHALFADGTDLYQQIHTVNLVLACFIPLGVYLHARVSVLDGPQSLVAAGLIAVLPLVVLFSRSEVLFLSSMSATAGTMVLYHRALNTEDPRLAHYLGFSAALLFGMAVAARPINFAFGIVAIVPAAVYLRRQGKAVLPRLVWLLALFAVAVHHFVTEMATQIVDITGDAGDPRIIRDIPAILHALVFENNYFRPTTLPVLVTASALVGLVWMARRHREGLVYLGTWFLLLYGGHGVVVAVDPVAAARYGLHSIVPVAFAAGAGALVAWRWWRGGGGDLTRRRVALVAVGVLGLGSLVSLGLYDLPETDIRQEYALLAELRDHHAPVHGALVVDPSLPHPDTRPRWDFMGDRVFGNARGQHFVVRPSQVPHSGPVYLWIGLPCVWQAGGPGQLSDTCSRALADRTWSPVVETVVSGRPQDPANGQDARGATLGLYRLGDSPTP